MSGPVVSVVIVTFESQDDISACLRSVLASDVSLEVIVVDNNSSDHTVSRVVLVMENRHECRLICNSENVGFAKAVNQGIAVSRGQYVLALNPDCVLRPGAVRDAMSELESNPLAAMAGCMLLNPDGTEQAGARRYLPTPWRAAVRILQLHRLAWLHPRLRGFMMNLEAVPSRPIEVEATSGAFMLVRRSAIEQVGLLDEGYFMHCEDLDWCVRFREAGWKIIFVPHATAVHKKGSSSRRRPIRVELYKHRGMIRFYRKFFRYRYPSILMWTVILAVWIRFTLKGFVMLISRALRWSISRLDKLTRGPGRYIP
jgi:GT2 family glycosyltransferase